MAENTNSNKQNTPTLFGIPLPPLPFVGSGQSTAPKVVFPAPPIPPPITRNTTGVVQVYKTPFEKIFGFGITVPKDFQAFKGLYSESGPNSFFIAFTPGFLSVVGKDKPEEEAVKGILDAFKAAGAKEYQVKYIDNARIVDEKGNVSAATIIAGERLLVGVALPVTQTQNSQNLPLLPLPPFFPFSGSQK
jgi:hypothetical protein